MNRVRELRQRKGWTVMTLAQKARVSERHLRRIEAGHTPNENYCIAISEALEHGTSYVFPEVEL